MFRHSLQFVSSSCSGVRPFKLACVATGMNIGRFTGPWGRVKIDARAFVVEHLASRSNLSADGIRGGIEGSSAASTAMTKGLRMSLLKSRISGSFPHWDNSKMVRAQHAFPAQVNKSRATAIEESDDFEVTRNLGSQIYRGLDSLYFVLCPVSSSLNPPDKQISSIS